MSKWATFLRITKSLAPIVLSLTPLGPIAGAVSAAIGEAEQIEGASGAEKLQHVTTIAVQAAHAANAQAGKVVVDPIAVQQEAGAVITATVGAINLAKGVHKDAA